MDELKLMANIINDISNKERCMSSRRQKEQINEIYHKSGADVIHFKNMLIDPSFENSHPYENDVLD